MQEAQLFWTDPVTHMRATQPDEPVFYFSRADLRRQAALFQARFPGEVTYAVKANPMPEIISTLFDAGITAFDVASPAEIALVRSVAPEARLHYHNPVRSAPEIAAARRAGVLSWSVDRLGELNKLEGLPKGTEIAVRLKLPVAGAAYDFGAKFGADPEGVKALLQEVVRQGFTPSITFHPGTQCCDPMAWMQYLEEIETIVEATGITPARINVGGGFPALHGDQAGLEAIFEALQGFAALPGRPILVAEPGRAMVAGCVSLLTRVKARHGAQIFLNDGLYGGLSEWRDLPDPVMKLSTLTPDGRPRASGRTPFEVFGPTCDSIDRLPKATLLPGDVQEGDFLLFEGAGAYAQALVTGFNGYGAARVVPVGAASTGQP